MDVSTTDLEGMTEPELRDLIRSAQAALDRQVALRAKITLKEIRRLAAEVGFEVSFAKVGKPVGGKAGVSTPRGKAAQKYRNPDNSSETWSGRGRPPKWAQAALDAGTDARGPPHGRPRRGGDLTRALTGGGRFPGGDTRRATTAVMEMRPREGLKRWRRQSPAAVVRLTPPLCSASALTSAPAG